MGVFLIQVSGAESGHEETGAKYWWQEPIEKGLYINYDWKLRASRADVWKSIREGHKVLIYCTGDVEPYPSQLSHIFTIIRVELGDEKAVLILGEKIELRQKMTRDEILGRVESGELSEGMGRCGTQGFNIGPIAESDLEVVRKWSESRELKEGMAISRETDLHKYLKEFPEKIEKGLKIIDPKDILPEGAGIPDLVCKDRDGNYVAVEIKPAEAGYDALGQIVSYKGALTKTTSAKVRGIIVASSFDPKMRFSVEITDSRGLKLVELKRYSVNFDLEDV